MPVFEYVKNTLKYDSVYLIARKISPVSDLYNTLLFTAVFQNQRNIYYIQRSVSIIGFSSMHYYCLLKVQLFFTYAPTTISQMYYSFTKYRPHKFMYNKCTCCHERTSQNVEAKIFLKILLFPRVEPYDYSINVLVYFGLFLVKRFLYFLP